MSGSQFNFPRKSKKTQVYDVAGSYNWTVPKGVYEIDYILVGAGGGGAGGTGSPAIAAGSGGSILISKLPVVPGATVNVVIGAGGSAGPYNAGAASDGGDGADSTLSTGPFNIKVSGGFKGRTNATTDANIPSPVNTGVGYAIVTADGGRGGRAPTATYGRAAEDSQLGVTSGNKNTNGDPGPGGGGSYGPGGNGANTVGSVPATAGQKGGGGGSGWGTLPGAAGGDGYCLISYSSPMN